ncbi:TetR/AcrR family transcriptional regulator [Actinoplanes aureus]|uniref:Helix-turn-helix transcriptional regulator n=1 Tax=Actinoplanes aureus TaxID=2792083 RepID=A0A931CGE4_9ACTN|nr:TetR/AcrR family transcriptional regulator [Actinoplanes aureus]MBG0567082.1 helix-turn-helix transcriptional regulator [Actinoplanes aureus]
MEVARRLFVEQGYAGTSVEQIAAQAGVSGRTVFAGFTAKINLLKQAVDTAIVGDSDDVPLAMRSAMQRVHQAATAHEAFERLADAYAEIVQRAYGIYTVVHRAADADPEIAELERLLEAQRLTGAGQLAATLADRLGVADPAAVAYMQDVLWTVGSPLQYGLLVHGRGWTIERYRDWTARALAALVPPAH